MISCDRCKLQVHKNTCISKVIIKTGQDYDEMHEDTRFHLCSSCYKVLHEYIAEGLEGFKRTFTK